MEEHEQEKFRIDELADLHERVSTLETSHMRLSRRITRVEDGHKGTFSGDDPLSGILSPGVMWMIVLLTLAPLCLEAWKEWKSSS